MSGLWAAAFMLRRLRAERGVALLLVLLVGLTSFIAAAGPRLYNQVADAALRQTIEDASTRRRNVALVQEFAMPGGVDPATHADGLGQSYQSMFGPGLERLVASREVVVTSPAFALRQLPRYATYVTLRSQSGIDGEITLRDGRLPQSTGEQLPSASFNSGFPTGPAPRVEIAVSDRTAAEAGLAVGAVYDATIDSSDPLLPFGGIGPIPATFEVVGIFSIDDPAAAVWFSDNRMEVPGADYEAEPPIVYVTALVAQDALPDLVASDLPFRYEWHYFIDPGAIDASQLGALVPELRRLETTFTTSALGGSDSERVALRTGLLPVLQGHVRQRAASEAVLSVAALGPLGLALAAVGMLAVLLITRRGPALALARGRGASTRLMLGAQVWEATLLAGSAALAGLLLAIVLIPSRPSELSTLLATGCAIGAVVLLAAATWRSARRPLEQSGRDQAAPIRLSARRLVLEATAVGVALAGVALLQQRGLTFDAEGRKIVRFDPFLAAVPLLVAFAAGLLVTRLYPIPIRALGWLAARRRDLVPVLGLRNIGRRPSLNTLPLLVLMLTAAFGAFTLVVTSSIDRGQLVASWREVGSDYRIEAPIGADLQFIDPTRVPAIEGVATEYLNPSAQLQSAWTTSRAQFQAIDVVAYDSVTASAPAPVGWPAEFYAAPQAGIGTVENPLPVLASPAMQMGVDPMAVGTVSRVRIGDMKVYVKVIGIREGLPGHSAGERYVAASLPALAAAVPFELEPNVLYVRAPASAGDALAAAVAARTPVPAIIESRHAWYAGLRGAPLNAVIAEGFRLGLAIAIAYSAFAVIIALTLTAARRTQDIAFLRTLGLSRRQALGMTMLEHGIPVLLALGPGVAIGIALAVLLQSSLGLDAFISDGSAYAIAFDWSSIASMAALLVIVVVVAVGVSTWLSRRAPVVEALRVGEA